MQFLSIGPLQLTFHKTFKVKDNGEPYNLPPSFGAFDIYKVSDYDCPKNWDKNGYFIAIHDKEAMWINFQTISPVALLAGVDGINVLNAKNFDGKMDNENYLVIPPQLWLDGWKNDDGTVSQFVSTEYGQGKSVGEQLQSQKQGMEFSVYELKNPENAVCVSHPTMTWGDSDTGECDYEMPVCFGCCSTQGMGRGGSLKQKVYKDPYGLKEWKDEPVEKAVVYLLNGTEFSKLTGKELTVAPEIEEYEGKWYGVKDEMDDVAGCGIFKKIKGIFS